jgi:hypothetical protein
MMKTLLKVVGTLNFVAYSMLMLSLYPAMRDMAGIPIAMLQLGYVEMIMAFGTYYLFWEYGE